MSWDKHESTPYDREVLSSRAGHIAVYRWDVEVHRVGPVVHYKPRIRTNEVPVVLDYGSNDLPSGTYRFRVRWIDADGESGAWSKWSEPVEVADPLPFVPQVASPFTAMELNFLNALLVAGFHEWLMVEPEGRVSSDGIDLNGDGRTDVGWDSLDVLSRHTTAVRIGSDLCDPSTMFFFLATDSSFMDEHEREQFNVISRAYLC